MKPTANFHEDREPSAIIIHAVCIDGVIIPAKMSPMDEACLLVMMEEYDEWKAKGVELPPLALTYAHQSLHLTYELTKRLSIRRATKLLTRLGAHRHERKPNPLARLFKTR